MRDQTCAVLLANGDADSGSKLGAARILVKGWGPLRWGLIAAIVLLLAIYAGVEFLGDRFVTDEDGAEAFGVLVASRYIPAFAPVVASMTAVRNFPKALIPPGALRALPELNGPGGRPAFISAVALPEGQPITRALLTDLGKSHGLASVLPLGQSAVSFSVDAVRGAGGWVQPGDAVSIFSTRREADPRWLNRPQTRLLFSSVQVLAVDHRRLGRSELEAKTTELSADAEGAGSVLTVLLSPAEAAKLIEEREGGRLSVLLRPLGDEGAWVEPVDHHE